MQNPPIDVVATNTRRSTVRIDVIVALVLATLLSICWTITDWSRIGRLILPDADDMMRLAQVRDWVNGQALNDWTQYRMAPPFGTPMHWSRLNDFGIAGIIVAATPLIGRHGAEIAAVILYPAVLFAFNIALSARIARRLWGDQAGIVAAILAALAYPGITLFIPGRIDHHALQIVVIEATVLALMHRPTIASGILAGLAVAVSLVIGLETVPQVAMLVGTIAVFWVVNGQDERRRLAGFAAALGGMTGVSVVAMRPTYWSVELCDAFTPASATGTLAVAAALGMLAYATPWLSGWRSRLFVGSVAGVIALGGTLAAYPVCLSGPYGLVDPFLRAAFLPHIDEANSIFAQASAARTLSIGGLLLVGCIVSVWMVARAPETWARAMPVVGVILVSALVTLSQARGTYIGAPMVAPVLAGLILAARRRSTWQTPALIAAWLASAGITYAEAPVVAVRVRNPGVRIPAATTPQILCNTGDAWEQVDRYPAGVVMAPTNMASYLIGATHLSTVGAGYHRNNRGNMAMYRYFLSRPDRSAAIARAWNVTYVAFCPGDFSEIDVTHSYPDSLATMLQTGRPPVGFVRLPLRGARLHLYRIR
ncbi:glycosyltransferase family 39 protein [Sphingomonas sp. PB2P12]|uniref:hypothetical protein n=1 Tax=Sphingomonas sandaracina TaxID=3096157 RepID=UPI002FCCAA9B